MEYLFLVGGIILGIVISIIFKSKNKIYGVIEVDHNTDMCKVHITSDELSNPNSKKAIFVIDHDGKISREEQGL